MAENQDFDVRLVSKAVVPPPVTKALGTGTSATHTKLSLNLPYSLNENQQGPTVEQAVPQAPQTHQ